jgi:hypothetical protein
MPMPPTTLGPGAFTQSQPQVSLVGGRTAVDPESVSIAALQASSGAGSINAKLSAALASIPIVGGEQSNMITGLSVAGYGGGKFDKVLRSGRTADLGTTFATDPVTDPGALYLWERDNSKGPLNVQWFGAYPRGPAATNRAAMQAAIDASAGRGIFIPEGWYELDASLKVCHFSGIIRGEGWGFPAVWSQGYLYGSAEWTDPDSHAPCAVLGTVLYFSADTHGIDTITGDTPLNQTGKRPNHLTVKDLALIGPGGAGTGCGITPTVIGGTPAHNAFRIVRNVLLGNWGVAMDGTNTLWGQYDSLQLIGNAIGFKSTSVFNANQIKNLTCTANLVALDFSGMELNEIDGLEVNSNVLGFRFGKYVGGGPSQLMIRNGYVEGNTTAIEALPAAGGAWGAGQHVVWDNVLFDQPETWTPTGWAIDRWVWRNCRMVAFSMRLGPTISNWSFPGTTLKDLQFIGTPSADPERVRLSDHVTQEPDTRVVTSWSKESSILLCNGVPGSCADTVITTVRAHGFSNGDEVFPVWSDQVPIYGPMLVGTNPAVDGYQDVIEKTGYFVINAAPTTFGLALAPAGAALHFMNPSSGQLYFAKPAVTATIRPDYLTGPVQRVWLDAATVTIEPPTNAVAGAEITFLLQQDATGSRAVVFSPAYVSAWSDAGNAANKRCSITFRYLDSGVWTQVTPQTPWLLRPYPFDWSLIAPVTHPLAMSGVSSYYDPVTGCVIAFGGYTGAAYSDKTWSFDPLTGEWTDISPVGSPQGRAGAGIVYDSVRGVGVLFGGSGNPWIPPQTWEFDGVNWTQIVTATTPAGRYGQQLAFDSARGVVVMYGVAGGGADACKTWEFDGLDWTLKDSVGLTAVQSLILVYDPKINKTVAFGGFDNAGATQTGLHHWDGTSWSTNLFAGAAPARGSAVGCYDSIRGVIVMTGGYSESGDLDSTWEVADTTWTRSRNLPNPVKYTMAFSFMPNVNRGVLFGGMNGAAYLADTLLYTR